MADTKPVVTAESSIGIKKTRAGKGSTQLNYDQILSHAGALTLEEKTELVKELKRQINSEVVNLQKMASNATEITKGL